MFGLYVERKKLPACLSGLSRKQQARIHVLREPTMELHGMHWNGGSRSEFHIVTLASGTLRRIGATLAPWDKQPLATIKAGEVLVETGTFCGKPATMTLHCLPCDALALLGIKVPLAPDTPVGIVADWLEEANRVEEAKQVRQLA